MSEINFFLPASTGDLRQVLGRQIANCGRKKFLPFFAIAHSIFLQQIALDTSLESIYMAKRKHLLLCARNLHSTRNECLEILISIVFSEHHSRGNDSRPQATACEILFARTQFFAALATRKAQFGTWGWVGRVSKVALTDTDEV